MVKVYKVEKPVSIEVRLSITKLMMEQMNALSVCITEEELLKTIDLAMESPGCEFFAAEYEHKIIGCAFLNTGIGLDKGGPYIWLNDLYVTKKHRRQGVAGKLLLNVIYWAEQEGFKGIELETGINNIATKKLYNSLGFYDIVSKRYGRHL
ncbi:Acetyltransferase (GNAT) family protein [Evansella caseinilytica]|uniref:Acetyltransferase (GNAT) family protein n=1 Tax=Evansella caseinilytica TaxID=1503961 RepID=A0A1H3PM01_9BACI|nr:GNAT family N-acetyltransferase [Evansella caseinilytica]SDZ02063.1 Acetyltransferase (GNAT) family protein [Evansella caseinilytica]